MQIIVSWKKQNSIINLIYNSYPNFHILRTAKKLAIVTLESSNYTKSYNLKIKELQA